MVSIAVIGSAKDDQMVAEEKVIELGKAIAKHKCTLITGGCRGYPYAAVRGARQENGKTVAMSPAKDEKEHVERYGFPLDQSEIVYTGLGIPGRNKEVVGNSDIVIVVGGSIGTLNELSLGLYGKKTVGSLLGTGGIADISGTIVNSCVTDVKRVFEEDPQKLVEKLLK